MDIVIVNSSETPIYQQISEQLAAQIIKGELPGDYCLPPIRTVAKELRVSVITVKKAWEELSRMGLIYAVVGRGSFVSEIKETALADKRCFLARERVIKDIEYYKTLGMTCEELVSLIKENY